MQKNSFIKNNYFNVLVPEKTHSVTRARKRSLKMLTSQSIQKSFIIAKKARLFPKENPPFREVDENSMENKISNFDRLKTQIKHLENSQFLSFKVCFPENSQKVEEVPEEYIVNNEFAASKKVSVLQRYKMSMKQHAKKRKLSSILRSTSNSFTQNNNYLNNMCLSMLKTDDIPITKQEITLRDRKRDTSTGAKKYYRPQTCSERAIDQQENSTQIRGRKIKSSASERNSRQSLIIMCY